jgi:hypothetical protein
MTFIAAMRWAKEGLTVFSKGERLEISGQHTPATWKFEHP